MFEAENHGRSGRERSLLSFGRVWPSEAESRVPDRDKDVDAATRHRLARSRREATPNPLLAALSAKPAETGRDPGDRQSSPAPGPTKVGWRIADLIPHRQSHDPERKEFERAREEWAGFDRAAVEASRSMRRQTGDGPPGETALPAEPSSSQTLDDPDLYWRPLIDPMRVVMGIANSKMLILTTTVLGALLGIAIAVSTPKKYEGVAELLIYARDLKIVDRDLTQSDLPSDAAMAIVENQVRVLTSGTVLNKVVDSLNLAADPEFNGEGAGSFGHAIAILRSLLSSGDTGREGDEGRVLAVRNLAESLTVQRGGKTFVVVITAKTQHPEKSALIANTLTDVFLQTHGEIRSDTAGRAANELTSRLDQLRADLEAAERKVEAYKNENDIADAQGRLISDEMVKLNERLSIARARTIELNAKAASAQEIDVNAVPDGTLPEQINSNVVTELRLQYASLKREAARLAVRLGPRHPEWLAIEAQLAGAREQIQTELRRIISSNQVELKRAVQREQDLASRLARIKVRQRGVSEDLVALRKLEREAAARRAVYEAFLLRARETGEQRDLNTANMSVISKAYPPLEPVGPSRSTITLAGMILGLMAGVGIGGARCHPELRRECQHVQTAQSASVRRSARNRLPRA
jgi:polysaccharide biosynthesis transport protein